MKTVCDTNIWRKLAKGEITEADLSKTNSQLCASILNIEELAKSNVILSDTEHAKQTIRLIMKIGCIIEKHPMLYLLQLHQQNDPHP